MTFLKQLHGKHQEQVRGLLNQDIALCVEMIENLEQIRNKLRWNITFFKEVLNNKQTIENLTVILEKNRRKSQKEEAEK